MKSLIKTSILAAVLSSSLIFISCEEFENLEINVPFSIEITRDGNHPDDHELDTLCLDTESETFRQHMDEFENLTFVEAAIRVKAVNPTSMTGTISVSVKKLDGTILFTQTLTNVRPADYMTTPYVIQLTPAQIQLINAYLSMIQQHQVSPCFIGELDTSGIPGWDVTKSITVVIDIVIRGEVKM